MREFKDFLDYVTIFMWRLMYAEKNSISLSIPEARRIVRMIDKWRAYFGFVRDRGYDGEFDLAVDVAGALEVKSALEVPSIRVPVKLVDNVVKSLMRFDSQRRSVDLSVFVTDADVKNQETFLAQVSDDFTMALSELRDYFYGIVTSDSPNVRLYEPFETISEAPNVGA